MLLLPVLLMVDPGQAIQVIFRDQAGVRSVTATIGERNIPLVKSQDTWKAILGVDLETKPGRYPLKISLTFDDRPAETRDLEIEVRDKKFPTTELKVDPGFVQLSPENQDRADREAREVARIYSAVSSEVFWSDPFRSPIEKAEGRNFGHRRVFNGQSRSPHSGVDLEAKTGTPIHTTNRGRVVLAKQLFFTGYTVIIDHGLGVYSLYAHLSKLDVRPGGIVERGQRIGLAGATGRVTGPHLHWGMRVQGSRVDPFSLIALAQHEIP